MAKTHITRQRRRAPRLEEQLSLLYHNPGGLEGRTSVTKNISVGGFCFETDMPLTRHDLLWVWIVKPLVGRSEEGFGVYTLAQVRWTERIGARKHQSGLEFVSIKDTEQQEIIRYVEEKLEN